MAFLCKSTLQSLYLKANQLQRRYSSLLLRQKQPTSSSTRSTSSISSTISCHSLWISPLNMVWIYLFLTFSSFRALNIKKTPCRGGHLVEEDHDMRPKLLSKLFRASTFEALACPPKKHAASHHAGHSATGLGGICRRCAPKKHPPKLRPRPLEPFLETI